MLVASFLSWWYGPGWQRVARNFKPRLNQVINAFSARQLLLTLFAPWRRIITYPGANLPDRSRALVDNLFSRMVGFVIRVFVLFTACITMLLVALLSIAEIIIWPLLPLAIPGCLIAGLII